MRYFGDYYGNKISSEILKLKDKLQETISLHSNMMRENKIHDDICDVCQHDEKRIIGNSNSNRNGNSYNSMNNDDKNNNDNKSNYDIGLNKKSIKDNNDGSNVCVGNTNCNNKNTNFVDTEIKKENEFSYCSENDDIAANIVDTGIGHNCNCNKCATDKKYKKVCDFTNQNTDCERVNDIHKIKNEILNNNNNLRFDDELKRSNWLIIQSQYLNFLSKSLEVSR